MTIRYTPEALQDLDDIKEHYESLGYFSSAQKHVKTITTAINRLKTTPNMGVSFRAKFGVDTDLEFIMADDIYMAVYRKRNDTIEIAYIIDARTNYIAWLFQL